MRHLVDGVGADAPVSPMARADWRPAFGKEVSCKCLSATFMSATRGTPMTVPRSSQEHAPTVPRSSRLELATRDPTL